MRSPSSQLISQLVPKRDIASFLSHWCDRPDWEQKYNTNDLEVEFWANGLWIKQAGIVAYSTLANFVIYSSNLRGSGLEVKQESKSIYLVQGTQRPFYAVYRQASGQLKCECMLYRNRANRWPSEIPAFFKAAGQQIFCHHTAAVEPVKLARSSAGSAEPPRQPVWC
jgi:hypothetical protein